ncbi:SagB family peptide dehydrogenase [Actinokineospora auranticolor]|uniref:SagB-type dehydrogenase family enzyme n=1 Tax=Actinokineospora auranticolor TaxID=155976 RepID=A0A2S6GER0_9PSEU|nr:SagB family peptide dehydrogenase [Actinokineospora auranticolor]PPK63725.1 SagB-type dehydrogenase family enzyme [Actinokineospora auranticolor]
MSFAHEYAAAVLRRGREPMAPVGFTPDWSDRPRKWKTYPGSAAFPLPDAAPAPAPDGRFTLPLLGGMLRDSYGLLGRRLGVHANEDLGSLPRYQHGGWSRGTASGGGLYPVSIYWVSGAAGPVLPGVYHYAPGGHAAHRLLAGDVSAEVAAALAAPERTDGVDQYLVLGVKYWQNAFKYNSFCYHAVSMDVGTVVRTWRLWAAAAGLRIAPLLWFDEARLADLLGIDNRAEGVFAVVPLRWGDPLPATAGAAAAVRHADLEKSRRVLEFETVTTLQVEAARVATERPAPGAVAAGAVAPADPGARWHPLPDPESTDPDVRAALRRRRSSFGRFDGRPIGAGQLAALLAAAAGTALDSDAETGATPPALAKLYVFVNHVHGVAAGVYEYAPATNALREVRPGAPGEFLQRNYFLANYNLERCAAVLVPAARTAAVLDAVGPRGYRLVNALIGAISQSTYTTAAALDLGCGVALGFDNVSYVEELGLAGSGELPLLLMLVGRDSARPADFRHEIA